MESLPINRREALRQLGIAGTGMLLAGRVRGQSAPLLVAGQSVEVEVWTVSPMTVRLTVRPLGAQGPSPVPFTAVTT